jgi:hypothetical protein
MPGADCVADFVVPVFDAAATTQATPNFMPAAERVAASIRGEPPEKSGRAEDHKIQFLRGPGNRKRFVFPAGRNIGAAITVTLLALLFAGGGALIHNLDGPMFIVVIGEVVGALIAWGALSLWFRETEISFDPNGVERSTRMLGQGGTRAVLTSEAAGVAYNCTSEVNGTPYFTIKIKLKEGDPVKLISGVRERDAKWICGEIAQTLGVAANCEASNIDESRIIRP